MEADRAREGIESSRENVLSSPVPSLSPSPPRMEEAVENFSTRVRVGGQGGSVVHLCPCSWPCDVSHVVQLRQGTVLERAAVLGW